jgi:hypothetical protein
MGSNGDVAATWVGFVAGTPTAQVATRPPSGSFSAPLDLSPPGNESSSASQVAEDAAGDTLVGYATFRANGAAAAFRPAGGAFGADQEISPAGQLVDGGPGGFNVAISGDGDGAFGLIAEESGGGFIPQVSLLDAVGWPWKRCRSQPRQPLECL